MRLLSPEASNAKLSKNAATNSGYETSILYLAPSNQARADVDLCPGASPGCRKACLFSAGRGKFQNVHNARVAKTLRFLDTPQEFLADLVHDLEYLVRKQQRTDVKQAVRLNGTSDIRWEAMPVLRKGVQYPGIPQAFPELQFYDYTKLPMRAMQFLKSSWPTNYHLTFSRSEINQAAVTQLIRTGVNVAVVFQGKQLPSTWMGQTVIDGTLHDQRFLDPRQVVVGLLAKGDAKKDATGFSVSVLEYEHNEFNRKVAGL
jgi:hypothetical protein